MVTPLVLVETVKIELHWTVSSHGGGSSKHDLSHVNGNLRTEVYHVRDWFTLRTEVRPAGTAVGVELYVG